MLGLKCLGGGILLTVCFWHCRKKAEHAHRMGIRLDAWITLLTYVRGQISCFGRPLQDILLSVSPRLLQSLDIDPGSLQPLRDYCRADAGLLPGCGGECLLSLADELGTVWREEQVERLDYYLGEMQQARQAYNNKLTEQLRLRYIMSICGTLGVMLLIW